ncbi:lipoate--protein ligase family protein [Salimicrobium flavidum]|uniref:Lipoate-protein ligase A n=1 Tax=Salimicrobium flavidum TaxID=570947 RepID=A0A1N7JCL7_9BACI|nr:biotin/lipoate A/B protein ligase family protein [Salimicrobium flavidum]SIS47068.1 lipoate-protein ligase A [Salimicrobium flavidum]
MNMALDEALMKWHREQKIPPVLRFYTWQPAGLSLGQFQKTKGRINTDGASRHRAEIVRRPTGGRAVLHDEELTYSIIVSEAHPMIPATVKDAYLILSKGLLNGFRNLGIETDYAIPEYGRTDNQSSVCFEEPSWYELTVNDKKIAGSAQVRQGGVLLQHGSIPIQTDEEKLFDMFLYPNEQVKKRSQQSFKNKAASIADITGEHPGLTQVRDAFLEGFHEGIGVNFESCSLSPHEWEEVRVLAETKYLTDEWNFKR